MICKKTGCFLIIFLIFSFMVGCVSFTPPEKRKSAIVNQEEQKESEQPKQLISNQARNVAIDQYNIWFATDKGVSRYDRVEKKWTHYTVQHGLASNDVRAVAVDEDRVWFGTDNGVSAYNYKDNTWKTYKKQDGLVDDAILCITVDGKYVWIGTEAGLSRYDKEIDSWATHHESSGRREFGLMFSFGRVRFFRDKVPVTAIVVDDNYVWIGTYKGALRYDKDKDSWTKYTKDDGLVDDKISAIAVDTDSVWFGTKDAGVSRYSKTDQAFVKSYTKRDLLASNRITSITVDGSYVWFGFANGGVQQYVPSVDTWRAFTKDDVLPSNHITTISSYGQEVWMGTYEDGIVRYDKKTDEWDSYEEAEILIDNDVREISVNEKQLWVATPRGLSRFDYQKKEWKNYKKADGLIENYITCVDSDSVGRVWIGTSKGLGALKVEHAASLKVGHAASLSKDEDWRFYAKEDGLLDNFITSINLIEGRLYIGTKKGLSIATVKDKKLKFIDSWRFKDFQIDYFDSSVNDVEKQENLLWLATSSGLVKYNLSNQETKILTEAHGLPDNYVNTVKVWYGQIWAGTQAGLHLVKGDATFNLEMVEPLIKSLRQRNVRAFEIGDEAIWVGTPQGVVRYDLTTGGLTDYTLENTNGNLAHDNVKSIALTGSEVWFGTRAGVSKLDKRYALESKNDIRLMNKAWTKYQALDSVDVLQSSYVARIVDDDPYIWFGNWAKSKNGAIGRYDKRTNTWNFFTRKNLPLKSSGNPITRIRWISPADDAVWVATNGGLLRYDKHFDIWRHYTTSDGMPNNDVYYVFIDETNKARRQEGKGARRQEGEEARRQEGKGGKRQRGKMVKGQKGEVAKGEIDKGIKRQEGEEARGQEGKGVKGQVGKGAKGQVGKGIKGQEGKRVKGQEGNKRDKFSTVEFNHQSSIVNRQSVVWLAHAGNVVSRYNPNTDEWISRQIDEASGWGGVATIDADERYVWFPTGNDGLRRYDKKTGNWEAIRKSDGLGSNSTHHVLVDGKYVWVTSWDSVSRYDLNTGKWKIYDENTVIHGSTMWMDKGIDGVWFLYDSWMEYPGTKYNNKTNSWYSIKSPEGHGAGASQVVETENDIWFATSREGLLRYSKASKTWTVYEQGREDFESSELPHRSLLVDNGKVWLGTQNGLLVYNIEKDNWTVYREAEPKLLSPRITALIADEEYLWCATSKGLSRYDKRKGRWKNFQAPNWGRGIPEPIIKGYIEWESLISNTISSLALDENYLWVGTRYGVSRYDLSADSWKSYFKFNGLPDDEIRDLVVSGYDVWVATAEGVGKYNRLSDDANAWRSYTSTSEIKTSGESKEYMESLVSNDVRCLAVDEKSIWFGTLEGVSRYDPKKARWQTIQLPYPEEISRSEAKPGIYLASLESSVSSRYKLVSCIETDQGTVWFGTAHGLIKHEVNSGKYTKYTEKDGLASNWITCIEMDEKEVWVGTAESGVSRYDRKTGKWLSFTASDSPLPHNRIHAIELDGDLVWIGTENGLARYSRQKNEWTLFESE